MKSKKLLLILLLVQLVLCLALSAFAAESELAFDITFDTVEPSGSIVNKGEKFTVAVTVTENPCFAYLSGTFTFNPEYVTYVSSSLENSVFTKDETKCMVNATANSLAAGKIPVTMYDLADAVLIMKGELCYAQTGVLVEFTFMANEDIPAEAVLEFGFDVLSKNYAYVQNYNPETGKGTGSVAINAPIGDTSNVLGIGEGHMHTMAPATCLENEYCSVCKKVFEGTALGHEWSEYKFDAEKHWKECTREDCDVISDEAAHKGGEATCMKQADCVDCGAAYGELSTEHVWAEEYKSNEAGHWHECAVEGCTATSESVAHVPGTDVQHDNEQHWYTCAQCDYVVSAEDHVMKHAGRENEVPATCYAKGSYVEVAKCACGYETRETKSVPMIDHNWAEATCTAPKTCQNDGCGATEGDVAPHAWVDANCTAPKTCSVCKATEGVALGHKWDAATCTAPKTCSVCKATEGNALGHTWTDATCTAPKTCSVCKATEGAALGHTWTDATCTAPKTCSVCKATEGAALGHKWTDATCTAPKTCSVCKATEGEALGHKWDAATCTTAKTCSVCKATEGEALGHTWVEANCTTAKTCSVCEATEGEALGHTWVEATCTAPKTCSVCEATEGEALGHTWAEATCTAPKTCSVCNTTEGNALGHTWVEANCTTAKTCSVCEATEGEALGHDWAAATCTAPKTCKRCSATEGEKLGHSFGEWETTKAPTTKEEGEDTRKCNNCDVTETRPVDMLPTDYTWLIIAVILVLAAAGIVVVVVLKKKRK